MAFICIIYFYLVRSSFRDELLEDFQPMKIEAEDTNDMDKQFDRFYIATYNIGEDHQIGEIRLWMLNPDDNKAYLISDLTSYIGQNYPSNLLLELRCKALVHFHKNPNVNRETQIIFIADLARETIGLPSNSNQNLLFLLEKPGAFIFEKEIGERIDAYSL